MESMKKYYVTYLDKEDDCITVWTMASSKQEAIEKVKGEHWEGVVDCYETKSNSIK